MGCDIHMIVQIEREYDDGKTWWRTIYPPAWWPRDEYEQRSIHEYSSQLPDGEAARELAWHLTHWYTDRDYVLFGALADVRNGDGVPSVAAHRGLPDGVTSDCDDGGEYDLGEHSFTWMTLAEVLAYPWDEVEARYEAGRLAEWRTIYLPAFERLAKERGVSPDRLRLVMGFDS